MGDDKPPESVMVAVRCQPMNQREIDQKEGKIVVIKEGGYCELEPPEGAKREFSYDYAYDEDSVQPDVYRNLGAPLLSKAFDGWNGTIFAYGQTGSGKSFSMTGSKEKPGIIPQLNKAMFERIEETQTSNPERKSLVTCSFLEIYNEARPFRPRCARRAWRWCVAAAARMCLQAIPRAAAPRSTAHPFSSIIALSVRTVVAIDTDAIVQADEEWERRRWRVGKPRFGLLMVKSTVCAIITVRSVQTRPVFRPCAAIVADAVAGV